MDSFYQNVFLPLSLPRFVGFSRLLIKFRVVVTWAAFSIMNFPWHHFYNRCETEFNALTSRWPTAIKEWKFNKFMLADFMVVKNSVQKSCLHKTKKITQRQINVDSGCWHGVFECTLLKSNAGAEKSAQRGEEKRVKMRAKWRGDNKQATRICFPPWGRGKPLARPVT